MKDNRLLNNSLSIPANIRKEKKLSYKDVGIIFLLAVIAPYVAQFLAEAIALIVSGGAKEAINSDTLIFVKLALIPIIMLAVMLVFCRTKQANLLDEIEIKNSFNKLNFIPVVLIVFGMLFGLSLVNTAFESLLGLIGYVAPVSQIPTIDNVGVLILSLIIMAILPAFVEETLMRGVVLNGVRQRNRKVASILLCSFMFALLHTNPMQTAYQFCSGVILCLVVLKTKSIILPMVIHFLNNATILVVEYLENIKAIQPIPAVSWIWNTLGIISLAVGIFLLFYFNRNNIETEQLVSKEEAEVPKKVDPKLMNPKIQAYSLGKGSGYYYAGMIILGVLWIVVFGMGMGII